MKIAREEVAQKLTDYLHHRITLAELVDWAESTMMEADFAAPLRHRDERDYVTPRDIVSRLGLANVEAFGMTWEHCEDFLSQLGYQVRLVISEAPSVASAKG